MGGKVTKHVTVRDHFETACIVSGLLTCSTGRFLNKCFLICCSQSNDLSLLSRLLFSHMSVVVIGQSKTCVSCLFCYIAVSADWHNHADNPLPSLHHKRNGTYILKHFPTRDLTRNATFRRRWYGKYSDDMRQHGQMMGTPIGNVR